jgi:hypothetical protein
MEDKIINPEISLIEYGIPYRGPFNGIKYLTTAWVSKLKYIDAEGTIDEYTRITAGMKSTRRFLLGDIEYTGSYGIVEQVTCYESAVDSNGFASHEQEVLYRKRSRNRESLLCEACFQIAARQLLKKYGCEDIISEVRDIVCFADESIGFTMVPFYNMSFLSAVIDNMSEDDIVACIGHIALIIWILSEELGINHRDLKGNNILIGLKTLYNKSPSPTLGPANGIHRVTSARKHMSIKYGNKMIEIAPHPSVHFVDFGFACCGTGKDTEISATNYFPSTDPCPKQGRDIFQLLTHIYLTIYNRGAKIVKYIEELLELPGRDYPAFLRMHGDNSVDWVYFLLGSMNFTAPKCEPYNVIRVLSKKYPHIIKLEDDL